MVPSLASVAGPGSHLRPVLLIWLAVLVVFGIFDPKVESVLAGAGWQDSNSQSVQARDTSARRASTHSHSSRGEL